MKQLARFLFAGLVVVLVVATSSQVWASPRFAGTIPTNPPVATNAPLPTPIPGIPITGDKGAEVNMGPAVLTPLDPNATITVTRQFLDEITPPLTGLVFTSDAFMVTANVLDTMVEVCFAYPPEYEQKGAKMYMLDNTLTPPDWVVVGGENPDNQPEILDGQMCAVVSVPENGLMVTLLGKP